MLSCCKSLSFSDKSRNSEAVNESPSRLWLPRFDIRSRLHLKMALYLIPPVWGINDLFGGIAHTVFNWRWFRRRSAYLILILFKVVSAILSSYKNCITEDVVLLATATRLKFPLQNSPQDRLYSSTIASVVVFIKSACFIAALPAEAEGPTTTTPRPPQYISEAIAN